MGGRGDNIKVNQRYIECKGMCFILLVQINTDGHVSDIGIGPLGSVAVALSVLCYGTLADFVSYSCLYTVSAC